MNAVRPKHPGDVAAGIEHYRQALLALIGKRRLSTADIHHLRVHCKHLRAAIRLLRHQGSRKRWQRRDHALRNFARRFGAARDWQVVRDTVQYLADSCRNMAGKDACARLLSALPRRRPPLPPLPFQVPAIDNPIASETAAYSVVTGLRETLARCRRLAKPVMAGTASVEQLHRLRKWVKYLGYQLLLAVETDAASDRLHRQLVALGHLLGVIHDLAHLEHWLALQHGIDRQLLATVAAMARQQRERLSVRAARRTNALFTGLRTLG